MTLALFDLDNTLLQTDSDYSWGLFLVRHNLVDVAEHQKANDYFYEQYKAGMLDINEYASFSQKFLSENDNDTLNGTLNKSATSLVLLRRQSTTHVQRHLINERFVSEMRPAALTAWHANIFRWQRL